MALQAWSHKLSSRINNLPLVIVGPMLRRVKNNSVSVFLALKESKTVTLKVFNEYGTVLLSNTEDTVSLGDNLHVIVVTASGGAVLAPNTTYFYDIEFGTSSTTLETPGVLEVGASGLYKISYNSSFNNIQRLPSFALPPSNVEHLRIIHASCRKPHGNSIDALSGVSDILEAAIGFTSMQTAIDRPHQLYLTGDQIYADDVADALLFMIQDAASELIQWTETLPGVSASSPSLGVGHRGYLIRTTAKFSTVDTSNDAALKRRSHLMYLSEYFMMYMFSWSPELWPSNTSHFPIYENVHEESGSPQHKSPFNKTLETLKTFPSTLGKVRKLFANIPTYMIFDDHEISDDWFLNLRWSNEVLSSSLGKRILQNGLTAYAIFQAWGNTSWRFEDHPVNGLTQGRKLLNYLDQNNSSNNFDNNVPGESISYWNKFKELVGMPYISGDDYHKWLVPNGNGIKWNFTLEFPYFQVIVLNTRTMREFTKKTYDWYPNLLGREKGLKQLDDIIPNSNYKFHLLVSPAPVMGVPRVEWWQRDFTGFTGTERVLYAQRDSEAWSLNEIGIERFLGKLADVLPNGRIVCLSGDVHYSYSARMEYWATHSYGGATGNNAHFVMAQLTASALQNETYGMKGTLDLQTIGWRRTGNKLEKPSLLMGFQNPNWNTLLIGTGHNNNSGWRVSGNPAITNVSREPETRKNAPPYGLALNQNLHPDWQYRIDYMRDESIQIDPSHAGPFNPNNVMPPPQGDRSEALARYIAAAENSADYNVSWGNGKEIVGKNNFGEVRFEWGNGELNKKVKYSVWWRLRGSKTTQLTLPPFPLTNYEFSLGKGLSAYPKPEDDLN